MANISLSSILERNRVSLEDFIRNNFIQSYEELLNFCDNRQYDLHVSESEYCEALKKTFRVKVVLGKSKKQCSDN